MASSNVLHTTTNTFKADVLDSDIPVVVDFWATWCGPCRTVGQHLDGIADELVGRVKIVKLDVDPNQPIAIEYQVQSLPTVLIFKNGKVVDKVVGNPGNRAKLKQFIERNL